jgi:hypothetical protein
MSDSENKRPTYVKIEGNKVSFGFHFHFVEQDGFYNAFIPAFNLTFCTKDKSKLDEKAKKMAIAYARYFLNVEGIKKFALELNKKGFRTPSHNYTMTEILHDKLKSANFSNCENQKLPAAFRSSRTSESVGSFEMA